jgi:hypothetical protein
MKLSGSSQAQIEGILEGRPVETAAGIANLKAYGDANGFSISPSVAASYEPIVQRTPSNLDPLLAQAPDFYGKVHALVSEQGGPNCVSCHFLAGDPPTNEAPVGWAPDLAHTRERLRPDWLRDWLTDPSRIYPGTTMPANFDRDEQWQSLYPAPAREQIEAVITWLFNLDRALIRN